MFQPKLTRFRLFAFVAVALLLVVYYLYHQLAPPYATYDALTKSEIHASLALVEDRNPKKYVFFRQLQGGFPYIVILKPNFRNHSRLIERLTTSLGAGFNNQASFSE